MVLPKIQEIVINEFSLYKLKSEIVLDMNDGVFCLAGANGLGKSTFINILSYALTGIVVDPKKNFSSVNSIPKFGPTIDQVIHCVFDIITDTI